MNRGFDSADRHKQKLQSPRKHKVLGPVLFAAGLLIVVGAAIFITAGGGLPAEMHHYYHTAMDTAIELQFNAAGRTQAEALKNDLFAEVDRLEQLLSRSAPGSDVGRVNAKAGVSPVSVDDETIAVAEAAFKYAALSEGAFDPTIAPLLDQWSFLGQEFRVPSPAELEALFPLVDYTLLEINRARGTIYLPAAGMSLDLGGIAKGYIVDRGLAVLTRAGVEHAFLNAGGDIGLIGPKPDGTPWRIGIRHPRNTAQYVGVIPLSGGAVVTSGDYERFFDQDDVRYHHILDPKTGQPVRSLISVTVTAPTAMEADVLSTAVFVLGPERGMALVESLSGVEAVLVTPDMEILISTGLEGKFELSD